MTGRMLAILLAGLALGLGIGFGSHWLDGGEQGAEAGSGAGSAHMETDQELEQRARTQLVEVPVVQRDRPEALESSADGLISERLFAFAEGAYRSARADAGQSADAIQAELPAFRERFEQNVRALPGRIALWVLNELEAAQAALEQAEAVQAGALNAFLAALKSGVAQEAEDFTLEGAFLDSFVRNRSQASSADGTLFATSKEPVTEGLVISFPPGIHSLDERRLRGPSGEAFPSDVTIEGAGMNSTLLRLSDISIRSDVERLTLRDMTIDCDNDGLFDLRSGNASLDVARVRLVRFDAGHGGCQLFTGDDGVVLAMRDSEILGGFGKNPGHGQLVSTAGSPTYALRFTNVLFDLVDPEFHSVDEGLFVGCRFENMTPNRMAGSEDMQFMNCSFGELLSNNYDEDALQRSLNELFPGAVD